MEILEQIGKISWNILPLTLIPLIMWGSLFFLWKDRVYRYRAQGWLDIKTHPISDDIRGFIATDGKKVDYLYLVEWGPYGEVLFNSYDKTYVKYWQPLPEAP